MCCLWGSKERTSQSIEGAWVRRTSAGIPLMFATSQLWTVNFHKNAQKFRIKIKNSKWYRREARRRKDVVDIRHPCISHNPRSTLVPFIVVGVVCILISQRKKLINATSSNTELKIARQILNGVRTAFRYSCSAMNYSAHALLMSITCIRTHHSHSADEGH